MKRKINKPILLSTLALTQSIGTVMLEFREIDKKSRIV